MMYSSDSQPGVCISPGAHKQVTGGTQNLKSPQNKPVPVFYLYKTGHQWGFGGRQSVTILFRGYTKE
jgi:hypothetical protein